MTTGKPSDPNKTLLGVPGDAQRALEQRDAEELLRTRYGNPHGPTPQGRSGPPPLPGQVKPPVPPAQPSAAAPAPAPLLQTNPAPGSGVQPRAGLAGPRVVQPASLNKTLVGMSPDLQAVLRGQGAPPTAAKPLSAQPVRAIGTPEPDYQASRPARVASQPPALPGRSGHNATLAQPPAMPGRASAAVQAPPAQAPAPPPPSAAATAARASGVRPTAAQAAGSGAVEPTVTQAPFNPPPASAEAPSWPARSDPPAPVPAPAPPNKRESTATAAHAATAHASSPPAAAGPSSALPVPNPAPAAFSVPPAPARASGPLPTSASSPAAASAPLSPNMQATRLATFEPGPLTASRTDDPPRATAERSRLSLNVEPPERASAPPPKRWPALSLIGLAIVAFGGVIVLRAPQLLPPPLAALVRRPALVPTEDSVNAATAQQLPPAAEPQAPAAQPALPAPSEASAAPAPAATDAIAAAAANPSAPAVAAPNPSATLSGASAELEKQAIDLLLANDYAAASAVYERLRAAEPGRPEYGVMIELLARTAAASACGQPGQEPCPTH